MNKYSRRFGELNKGDANIAGGKGASLGEMTQAGIPVPPGFVVLSTTFDEFIKDADLVQEIDAILDSVDHKETHTVESASEKIQGLIKHAVMPEHIASEILSEFKVLGAQYVAVRSSATAEDGQDHAWAGQLDSYLNTREDNLLEKVKHCWASLFTPRAIFYRFEKGLHTTQISVAVVVQKMVQSEVSGIAFSVHPVTEDFNQLIIEAGYGLGEAIVSGSITPDSYVVEKDPRSIIDVNIADQKRAIVKSDTGNEWVMVENEKRELQKLSQEQIFELAVIIMGIENHYGFPCDIEWAYESKKFYIVQSRPITTLKDRVQKKISPQSENSGNKAPVFNGKEWFLTITRNMSFWHQCASNDGNYKYTKDFGVDANYEVLFTTTGSTKTDLFANKENYEKYVSALFSATDSLDKMDLLKNKYELFARELVDSLVKCKEKLSHDNLKDFLDKYARFTSGLNITAILGRIYSEKLQAKLTEMNIPLDKQANMMALVTYPDEKTPFFTSQIDLLQIVVDLQNNKLSTGDLDGRISDWLDKHGYIPVNFSEEPYTKEEIRKQIDALMNENCLLKMEVFVNQHNESIEKAAALINEINDKEVARLSKTLARITSLNEFRKNVFSKVSLSYRPLFVEIAKKMNSENWRDCYYLTSDEILDVLDGKNIDINKIKVEREFAGGYPDKDGNLVLLSKDELSSLKKYIEISRAQGDGTDSNVIKGFSANKGKITGKVKVIVSAKDFPKFEKGEILVAAMTSVDFVPVMEKAAAFVTNEGGITSHASIVAREMNKPCIIGTKIATQILKDGDIVEVDADNGVVRVIKKNDTNESNKPKFNSPELRDFNPDDYHFDGLWKNDLFPTFFWQDCWVPDIVKDLGIDLDGVGVMNLKGGHFLVNKALRAKVDKQVKELIEKRNSSFFKNIVSVSDRVFAWAVEQGDLLSKKEPNLDNFIEFVKTAKRINFLWLVGATYTNWPVEEKLQEAVIADKIPAERVMDLIPKINTPLHSYQHGLVEFKKEIGERSFEEVKKDSELFGRLESFAKEFVWVEIFNFIGEPMTAERLYNQVGHLDEKAAIEHELYVPENPLSENLKFITECMHDVGYMKQGGAEYFSIFSEKLLPFLRSIANKIGVSYRELMCLSIYEIEDALRGQLDSDKLKFLAAKRVGVNDWALVGGKDGKLIFIENTEDVKTLVEKMIPRTGADTKELFGQIGNRGLYKGPVKVVMNTYDFDKVLPGDVLVTTMTTPDFIVLMQKSGAIVTDIGGLLCHAAIVSREMNKPCVIGTKFATQVLKDGDMVEVDADNGVVRIIK